MRTPQYEITDMYEHIDSRFSNISGVFRAPTIIVPRPYIIIIINNDNSIMFFFFETHINAQYKTPSQRTKKTSPPPHNWKLITFPNYSRLSYGFWWNQIDVGYRDLDRARKLHDEEVLLDDSSCAKISSLCGHFDINCGNGYE